MVVTFVEAERVDTSRRLCIVGVLPDVEEVLYVVNVVVGSGLSREAVGHTKAGTDKHGVVRVGEIERAVAVGVERFATPVAVLGLGVGCLRGVGSAGVGSDVVAVGGEVLGVGIVGVLVNAHPVDVHLSLIASVGHGCDASCVVYARVIATYCQVEDEEERLLEVVAYVAGVGA